MKKKLILLFNIFISFATLTSCNFIKANKTNYMSINIMVFDTMVDIKINNKYPNTHLKNIADIYRKIDRYADNFRSYDGMSVYDLNVEREIPSSDILKSLIQASIELKEKTNGYFNPFIGRLADKWKEIVKDIKDFEDNKLSKDDINSKLELMNSSIDSELEIMNNSYIEFSDDKIKIVGDANLDLGGIAKGYATELAHQYLIDNEIDDYLIDAGNSNILLGNRDKGYNVGLSKPYSDSYYKSLNLTDKSIGTSSPKYQGSEFNDFRYHHLISPYTGLPVNNYSSVTVICDNSTYADVFSTAIFTMDIDTAKEFAKDNNIGILLCSDNEIIYEKVDTESEEV
jgi:thiamine biosynthesis lipoprotein